MHSTIVYVLCKNHNAIFAPHKFVLFSISLGTTKRLLSNWKQILCRFLGENNCINCIVKVAVHLNPRWNFLLSLSCISNKKFQRAKATVSKRICPKCGVREKRISHQFFRFNFIISFGTINLTYLEHVWNLNTYMFLFLQKPLHKENIQRGLKELTNIDRHGSTTF